MGVVFTLIEFACDAKSSARTRPDVQRAFEVARETILQGSTIRTTDREGSGTKNTRLAEGISAKGKLPHPYFARKSLHDLAGFFTPRRVA